MNFRSVPFVLLVGAMGVASAGFSQTIYSGGVVNAASFETGVAPGSVIAIFGTDLAAASVAASTVPRPFQLGGTRVLVNGASVPLFYVSPTQINAQLPYELEGGPTTIAVEVNGSPGPARSFTVLPIAPGIFVYGTSHAVAVTQDGFLNTTQKVAMPGTLLTVYMVGQGAVDAKVTTGAASPADPLACPTRSVTATIAGRPVEVVSAALAPGSVGLLTVAVRVPNVGGELPLIVTIGDVASNAATVSLGWTVGPGPIE